jgi:outer membrane protein insertion porin family
MKVPGLILGLLLPLFGQAQQQYYGTAVSSIAISGSESQSDLSTLPVHTGDVLTPENLRAAIQALYDTGHYNYVEADAEVAAVGTTALTFRVKPVTFFSTFRLQPEDLLERGLSSHFRLPTGEKFNTSAVDRIVQDTTELLKSEGYFQATITPDYETDETTGLVVVTLKANAGPKAKVGMVHIKGGEQTFSPEELASAFRVKTGVDFSSSKLDKGVADLRSKFGELQFLNTKVTADRTYNASTNAVDIDVTVQPGQFALVQTRPIELSKKKLHDLIPIYEEGTFDSDLVEEGRLAVRKEMQQDGYFDAEVSAEIIEVDPSLGNAVQINYTITPGTKHEVREVRISGNQYFTTDEIRRRIKSRRGTMFDRSVFSADLLEEDRKLIEAMYRNAGFEDSVVEARAEDMDHEITVVFQIEEGTRLTIMILSIEGNSRISTGDLQEALHLKEGDTYIPGAVDQARADLTQFYYTRGYADARVERTVDRIDGKAGVHVTFQINEGERYLLGQILVSGNSLTRDKVIRRSSGLQEYTPYNPESILEAQQKLYASGLFSRVEIVALNEGLPGVRNVLIQVEDAKPIQLTYGVGYQEFEHARGTFEVSHNNLFGLNRSLSFRLRGSSRERLAQATYHEPRLFNHELDGFVTAFVEHSERPNFSFSRIDFSVQMLKRFAMRNSLLMSTSYQKVNIGDTRVNPHAVNDPAQVGPCQICQTARVSASLIRDHRNDPVNPTSGTFHSTTLQVASNILGSKLNFTSFFTQHALYVPWRSGVLVTALRFGWNQPFGQTAQLAPGQIQQLPATERYFAGGSTTLRGFGLDNARPPDDLGLEGGNTVVIGNVEYRFPIRTIPISGMGGALFYDTGNPFAHLSNIRIQQFSHTVGFGIRYNTPFGPVRVDLGLNLAPEPNPDGTKGARVKLFFTLGNPF